jgi:HSP20 family molecular chaperone IbpA
MKTRGPLDGLTGLEALAEIGRRLGELPAAVTDAVKAAQAASGGQGSDAEGNVQHAFTINTPNGPLKGMATVGLRRGTLSGTAPRREGSGATARPRGRATAPDVKGAREPLIDCFDEGEDICVTAEMPGVRADELDFSIEAAALTIRSTGERRYHAMVDLPAPVVAASLAPELRNGILSVRLRKVPS